MAAPAHDSSAFAAALAAYQQEQQRSAFLSNFVREQLADEELETEEEETANEIRRRRVYERKDYKTSAWWQELQEEDLSVNGSRANRRFRQDFRIPYAMFEELVTLVRERRWFPSAEKDALGRACIPVELKVLACLQLLGRGNVFQDIYHMSWISTQTAAATFHRFCKHFATELYDEHIFLPTGMHQDKVMADYARIGFTGAVGSTDVTHLSWGMCPYNQARSHTGKEGFPTLAYQVTVDHTKRVLAVTPGFTGSTNDKTIIRFDGAVTKIRTDPTYTDRTYKLYRRDGISFEVKGCYLLVDNGYHKWTTLIPPSKCPIDYDDLVFSKRLESARKDVECLFGIVKSRFRIVKGVLQYHKKSDIDNIFFTCCILHNMLHTYDNMGEMDVAPGWRSSAHIEHTGGDESSDDLSSVGAKDVQQGGEVEEGFEGRRRQLVESYMYRKSIHDIVWLSS